MKRLHALIALCALPYLTCSADNTDNTVVIPPSCTDGIKNENESDIDCGGECSTCADGKACVSAANCQSGVCSGSRCQAASCTDGVKNGAEVAVDCGGGCGLCDTGKSCTDAAQCKSGVCQSGSCQAASCTDNVKNGNELDVD